MLYIKEIMMKKVLLIMLPVVFLSACASSGRPVEDVQKKAVVEEYPTVPDFDVRQMSRAEVMSAIDQCESGGMRPFVEYLNQKTRFGRVMVPVNVHCNPTRTKQ
jgi:PBP1b-binding outer membrane lipoprotein LpoB